MRFVSRFATVILWALAVFSILAGALGVASMTGFARLATVSDGTAAPVAFSGSLAIAVQKNSSDVQVGDMLLVGAHSAGGSTLGEVIAVGETDAGNVSVMLKAPGLTMPDEWSYELGTRTYEELFSVPLIGYPLSFFENLDLPVLTVILAGVLIIMLLILFKRAFFQRPEKDEKHWFARLEPKQDDHALEELGAMFTEAGIQAPEIVVEEDTSWTRRRRA